MHKCMNTIILLKNYAGEHLFPCIFIITLPQGSIWWRKH